MPRLSFSAQFLLYTIDVGLDNVGNEHGTPDWDCLLAELTATRPVIRTLIFIEEKLPFFFPNTIAGAVGHLESRWEKRAVYMLTSFIEAHSHAQKKIHSFIGADQGESMDHQRNPIHQDYSPPIIGTSSLSTQQIPEELKVLEESKTAVESYPS